MNLKLVKIMAAGVAFVSLVGLACGLGAPEPTATPLPPPPTNTAPPPTEPPPPPTNTPVPAPTEAPPPTDAPDTGEPFTGGFDDFSSDYGGWEVFDGAGVDTSFGIFRLGPFTQCADVGSDDPYGCFSQCLVCGVVSDYEMQVDAAYLDGVSDRTFGMVLRFADSNGNNLVDSNDYYLDFSVSVYDQYFVVWEYFNGSWSRVYNTFDGSIQPGTNINTLYAQSYGGGTEVDLYVNDTFVANIFNIPINTGTVGLAVGGRSIEAGFDNFEIYIPPAP